MAPTNEQVVLYAVQASIEEDIPTVRRLTQQHALRSELVLRVLLTFLPESTDPTSYVPFLEELAAGQGGSKADSTEHAEETPYKEEIAPREARRRVKALRLLPLSVPDQHIRQEADTLPAELISFLLLRARRIDDETGSLPLVQQLLEPFVERCMYLKLWMGSTILPLLRLNYEIYPDRDVPISLADFEALRGGVALDTLIGGGTEGAETADDYIRDLKQIVAPWMMGEIVRRKWRQQTEHAPLACWGWVNNWLLHLGERDPLTALLIARSRNWADPTDVDDGGWIGMHNGIISEVWGTPHGDDSEDRRMVIDKYIRACMCLFYTVRVSPVEALNPLEDVLVKFAERTDMAKVVSDILQTGTSEDAAISPDFFESAKGMAHKMQVVELMDDENPFTNPGDKSPALYAAYILRAARLLLSLKQPYPISKILQTSLLGTSNEQKVLLQRVLQNIEDKRNDDSVCREIKKQVFELASEPAATDEIGEKQGPYGIFSRIIQEDASALEVLVLRTQINAARHNLAIEDYLHTPKPPLSRSQVEETVLQVAKAVYDGASNGNRTRGGMKKASDIVTAFHPEFPDSAPFREIEALLRATHSLSFYTLALQHGVPCQPVNIRIHSQPLTLIDKVLAQNPRSYAQLDNLIGIGTDLVRAGLIKPELDGPTHSSFSSSTSADELSTTALVTRQITAKAISAALVEGDFDTAYSYITTRLSSHAGSLASSDQSQDDILWRAAYAAGRWSPPPASSLRAGSKHLRRLEQKMELLSQALALAPASELTEVLSTWQNCETQVNNALAAEAAADDKWDDKGDGRRAMVSDRHLPGGFGEEAWVPNVEGGGGRDQGRGGAGGRYAEEEAPMGLFDVARGAAAALQKSAFPLRGVAGTIGGGGSASGSVSDGEGYGEEHHRVRKRDMVSSAVASGLASGIGWVIGATPAREG